VGGFFPADVQGHVSGSLSVECGIEIFHDDFEISVMKNLDEKGDFRFLIHFSFFLLYFPFREMLVFPNFFAGFCSILTFQLLLLSFDFPPFYALLRSILPKAGQGPSKEVMDSGVLRVTVVGKGSKGSLVKSCLYYPTDPGYRDTARMLVESGLVLALEEEKVKVGGGIWTPAACQVKNMQRILFYGSSLFFYQNLLFLLREKHC
jgi:hypothetical protein